MNLQRKAIYNERNAILDGKNLTERIPEIIEDAVEQNVLEYCSPKLASDDWDCQQVNQWLEQMTGDSSLTVDSFDHADDAYVLIDLISQDFQSRYDSRAQEIGSVFSDIQSQVMLRFIDTKWMAHLQDMDYLKASIGLRAYGQRDPLVEYREEAHRMFSTLTNSIYEDFLRFLLRAPIVVQEVAPAEENPLDGEVRYSNPEEALNSSATQAQRIATAGAQAQGIPDQNPKEQKPAAHTPIEKDKNDPYANVGRNDPCPCGSGKKFKKCHGSHL
jgi:preprotein translocase subunit SecA